MAHVPPPVGLGDVLELGRGALFLLRVIDLVQTRSDSPVAALVKVAYVGEADGV